jgi:putative membrane protein
MEPPFAQIEKSTKFPGPADHLANERTFLAWVRTSIALMGFGFVIVKFALFLQQLSIMMTDKTVLPVKGNSAMIGFIMVCLGALVAVLAYIRYRNIQQQLNRNQYVTSNWLSLLIILGIVTGSILMVLYLIPGL